MSLLKSILGGFAFLVAAAILVPVVFLTIMAFLHKPGANESIGFDPVSMAKSPLVWVCALLAFTLGFLCAANWGKTR